MNKRHTNIVASYLVLIKGSRVLLCKRQNTGYSDGQYSLIVGHLEPGETFTKTIIREAKEEAGISLDKKNLLALHVQHCKSELNATERVHVYFTSNDWKGKIVNKEPDKCEHLKWFDFEKLPSNIVPHVYEALKNIKKKVFYSEQGW
ncbi:MAG: NUDIX domain-containing protein [Candidatus Levybacteria bacterium]|nr:NUDIX domain-containing protein [Candidatus Levybacteria bacterium]